MKELAKLPLQTRDVDVARVQRIIEGKARLQGVHRRDHFRDLMAGTLTLGDMVQVFMLLTEYPRFRLLLRVLVEL